MSKQLLTGLRARTALHLPLQASQRYQAMWLGCLDHCLYPYIHTKMPSVSLCPIPSQNITALKLGQPDNDEPSPKRRAISSADCGSFRGLLEGYHYHELSSGSELLSDVCMTEDAIQTSTSSSLSSNVATNTPDGSFGDGMSMDGVAISSPQICYGMVSYKLLTSTF